MKLKIHNFKNKIHFFLKEYKQNFFLSNYFKCITQQAVKLSKALGFSLLNITKCKICILTELAFVGFGQGLPPPGPLQNDMTG